MHAHFVTQKSQTTGPIIDVSLWAQPLRRWTGVLLACLAIAAGATSSLAMPPHTPEQAALATVAAQPSPSMEVASAPQIAIEHFLFGPTTLTVPVGTTVTWVNHDDDLHTVASATGLFSSPSLDTDEAFAYRFATPGTYAYFCALHPHMTGTIIVP